MSEKLCKECEYFRIRQDYKNVYEWGLAECTKHNLLTDFRSKKKFETLSCVEGGIRNDGVGSKTERV